MALIPYQFIPSFSAVVIIMIFCLAARLAYSWDYEKIHEGDVIPLENQTSPSICGRAQHLYLILVDTGVWHGSGTTAHVRLEIHARNFCSRIYCLRPCKPNRKILQRGNRNIFVLKTTDCLGEIYSLSILMFSHGDEVSWFLDRIKVIDISHNHRWIFPCYRWMSTSQKPSIVLKLFPHGSKIPLFSHTIYTRWTELHTWISIFANYNRLGRLSRIERITLCANMLMTVLFAYHVLLRMSQWADYFADPDSADEFAVFTFVMLVICGSVLAIWYSYIFEAILRNSVPISFSVEELSSDLDKIRCVDCEITNPLVTDIAIHHSEFGDQVDCNRNPIKTARCEGCRDEDEINLPMTDCTRQQYMHSPTLLLEDMLDARVRKERKTMIDPMLSNRYHEISEKYVRFFRTWTGLSTMFADALDDLKSYLIRNSNCDLGKHRKNLTWLMGTMQNVQDENCMKRKRSQSDEQPLDIPENVLFPTGPSENDPCCEKRESCCKKLQCKDTVRLIRLVVFLILIAVTDSLNSINSASPTNTTYNLPGELIAHLHHLVFYLMYAVHTLVLQRNSLYQVCNGVLVKRVESVDEFVCTFMKDPESSNFELARDPGYTCENNQWLICDKTGRARVEQDDDEHIGTSWSESVSEIKAHAMDHTKTAVMKAMTAVIQIIDHRRPLATLADFLRFRASQDEPLQWASTCVDFMLPLVLVISRPLILHVYYFTGIMCGHDSVAGQVEQYLQTVITNAALQAVREIKKSVDPLDDAWLHLSPRQRFSIDSNDQEVVSTDYEVLVELLKECLYRNEVLNASTTPRCCEGKAHIGDIKVLQMLLEEGKLNPSQLACGRMINAMCKLVECYRKRLLRIEKFMSQALLTLTDSQELLTTTDPPPCYSSYVNEGNAFVMTIRQQLLQMSFIVSKLLQRSESLCKHICDSPTTPQPPLYWTTPSYGNQPFIQAVEFYKDYIIDDKEISPLSNSEVLNIQAIAFNVNGLDMPQECSLLVYIYLALQNLVFLGLFMYWSSEVEPIAGLVCLVVLVAGAMLDFFIFQPIKIFLVASLIRRYFTVEGERYPKKSAGKREETTFAIEE